MDKIKKITLSLFFIIIYSQNVFSAPYVNLRITYDGKTHSYNKEKVYLHINSEKVENLPMEPIILNNYTLVPAREVFERIGASVLWNEHKEEVKIIYNDMNVLIKINDKNAFVNNKLFKMPIDAKIINGKTMIPVRFVSEAIGFLVEWNNITRVINISEIILDKIVNIESTTESTNNITTFHENNKNLISIEKITMPDSDQKTFSISANKQIERFEKVILGDNLVAIDIYNSKNNIKGNKFESVSENVFNVYIENKENNVTRFIFKTKNDVFNHNFLSNDKKTIFVNFGGNDIKSIELYNDGDIDVLKIRGEFAPNVEIIKRETENKLVINIKNSSITEFNENINKGKYVSNIKYSKEHDYNFSIIIDLIQDAHFTSNVEGQYTIIKIGKVNNDKINPITSIQNKQFIIEKNNNLNIDIKNIKHEDDYLNKKYILTFERDISSLILPGEYSIDNEFVEGIIVKNVNGVTQVIINCKKITAVNITEDSSKIYINTISPKEKYKNIIVIDPGHGGSDPGTSGNGLIEKHINLDITIRLLKLFENNNDIKVYSTRLTDIYPNFNDRTNMANEVGDIFISIHQNSADKNPNPNGTEVFYLNSNTSDRGITSKEMAKIFQYNLVKSLNTLDRKIKTSNLIVLRNSKIPAILCEVGFISNQIEASKLATESYRQLVAQTLYNSCIEVLEKYPSNR